MSELRLDRLLGEIARRSDVPLELDASGSCAMRYGAGFEMTLTTIENGDGVLIHAPLSRLNGVDPLGQLRRAMELNLYGVETAGATLGLAPDSEWIILSRRLPLAHMDSHGLEQAILTFADLTADLSARLKDDSPAPDEVAWPGVAEATPDLLFDLIKA